MRTGSEFGAESMICRSSIWTDWVRAALGGVVRRKMAVSGMLEEHKRINQGEEKAMDGRRWLEKVSNELIKQYTKS
jgi:hypothetical protein